MRYFWLALALSACGIQGDLYLPDGDTPKAIEQKQEPRGPVIDEDTLPDDL